MSCFGHEHPSEYFDTADQQFATPGSCGRLSIDLSDLQQTAKDVLSEFRVSNLADSTQDSMAQLIRALINVLTEKEASSLTTRVSQNKQGLFEIARANFQFDDAAQKSGRQQDIRAMRDSSEEKPEEIEAEKDGIVAEDMGISDVAVTVTYTTLTTVLVLAEAGDGVDADDGNCVCVTVSVTATVTVDAAAGDDTEASPGGETLEGDVGTEADEKPEEADADTEIVEAADALGDPILATGADDTGDAVADAPGVYRTGVGTKVELGPGGGRPDG